MKNARYLDTEKDQQNGNAKNNELSSIKEYVVVNTTNDADDDFDDDLKPDN